MIPTWTEAEFKDRNRDPVAEIVAAREEVMTQREIVKQSPRRPIITLDKIKGKKNGKRR